MYYGVQFTMEGEVLYFLVTEASVASNVRRTMEISVPIRAVFVICQDDNPANFEQISNLRPLENIFPVPGSSPEKISQEILKICNDFPSKKIFLIDHDALPEQELFHLHQFLWQNQGQENVYFIDFNGQDGKDDGEFLDIYQDDVESMLFNTLQTFDGVSHGENSR